MVDIRPVQAHEMDEAVKLADSVFRDVEQSSMLSAFPLVFSKSLGQSFGAFLEGKLVAFAGIVPAYLKIGSIRLPIYSLGSVCTDPDYRGKGYAGDILDRIKKHAALTEASLILISGDRPLYTRAQCYHHGALKRYMLNNELASTLKKAPEDVTIREFNSTSDWFRLHEISTTRDVHYEQSLTELANMLSDQAYASCLKHEHKTLVAEKEGRITAFAVISAPGVYNSKSAPFLVEQAGESGIVGSLLAHAVEAYKLPKLEVIVPWHEMDMHQLLQDVPYENERNYGTVHVVDPELFIKQIRPYLVSKNEALGSKVQLRYKNNDSYQLILNETVLDLELHQLISLLFDTEPTYNAESLIKEKFSLIFPIPIPYIGGLNYI